MTEEEKRQRSETVKQRRANMSEEEKLKSRFYDDPMAYSPKCNICVHRQAHKPFFDKIICDVYTENIPDKFLEDTICEDFIQFEK